MPLVDRRGSAAGSDSAERHTRAPVEPPVKIYSRWLGAARPEAGSTVVMIHGLISGSHASWWLTAAPRLARKRRVLVYDLRGHGYSDRPLSGYRITDHLDDLWGLCEREGIERASIVGHSFGARLAIEAARSRPEFVAAIAAVEAPLCDPLGGIEEWRRTVDRSQPEPRPAARSGNAARVSWDATTIGADLDHPWPTLAELASIQCPVAAYFGDRSPFRNSAALAEAAFGRNAVHRLAGGHGLHVDAKADLAQRLDEFLPGPVNDQGDLAGRAGRG